MDWISCCCTKDNRPLQAVETAAALPKAAKSEADAPLNRPAAPAAQELHRPNESSKTETRPLLVEVKKEPELPQGQFRISLSREGFAPSDLGLDIDGNNGVVEPETLLILKVRDGPVQEWNMRDVDGQLQVCHGDRIIEANGVSGDAHRLQEILKNERGKLELIIKRPKEVGATLRKSMGNKATEKIGLDIVHSMFESLLIKRVKDGLIKDWNQRHPGAEISVGDRIIQVNGIRGDSLRMLELVASEDYLDIIVAKTSVD